MALRRVYQAPKLKKMHVALQTAFLSLTLLSVNQSAMAEETIALEQIDVVAPKVSDTQPVKGYQAKKSNAATKTDILLRDVPQAVSVITQDLIQDQSIQSIAEAVRYVPGVSAVQGEGNRDALVFRGNQTTGDLFVDGLRDDVQTYRDLYNTDRIEVLKGPNGMIFGRGGAGGVVNRVSKEAGWDPISQITASYGAYDQKRISADFGQAITEDVAFRINAVYENSDSYRDGVNIERYGVTPTLTLKPTENTKVVFGFEYFEDKRIADRGVPSQANVAGNLTVNNTDFKRRPYKIGDHDTFFGNARLSPTETETVAFNAAIEHAFENGVTIKNRTRYADYDKYYQNVFARAPVSITDTVQLGAYLDNTTRENFINQTDLTFSLKTGSIEHKLLAGVEFANQKTDNQRLQQTNSEAVGTVSASNPFIDNITFDVLVRDQKSDVDVFGVYVQDQIILSSKWQAIVGLRHDKFKTDYTNNFTNESFDVKDNLLSPRAGLIFKPVDPVSIYANYSLSYVPRAGDQLVGLTATNFNADPEKFINYELGAKWDINPDLSLTAAVYKLERENVGIADPNNPNGPILLIDGQETKGVELSIAGNITSQWSMFGGYAYQDAEVTKQQGVGNGALLKGAELAQTPKHTFSLWNRYDINQTWGVALGVISRSDMYAQSPTASQSTLLPGYTRLDAAIYANINKQTRLQINLENLTNKEYALYAHNNNNITPGSPITGRATLVYNF